jgi:hypothetical protein
MKRKMKFFEYKKDYYAMICAYTKEDADKLYREVVFDPDEDAKEHIELESTEVYYEDALEKFCAAKPDGYDPDDPEDPKQYFENTIKTGRSDILIISGDLV